MVTKKKLEWQGGILDSGTDTPIVIKTSKSQSASREHAQSQSKTTVSTSPASQTPNLKKITGRCSLRLEKKGRGGNPAIILFNFSDPNAKHIANLKQLCSDLKTKLACGGTAENGEILLTLQDIEKVKKILLNFFDLKT